MTFEDHGTEIRTVSEAPCEIDGCTDLPTTRIVGYIQFTLDGYRYSSGHMLLCDGCWDRVKGELSDTRRIEDAMTTDDERDP